MLHAGKDCGLLMNGVGVTVQIITVCFHSAAPYKYNFTGILHLYAKIQFFQNLDAALVLNRNRKFDKLDRPYGANVSNEGFDHMKIEIRGKLIGAHPEYYAQPIVVRIGRVEVNTPETGLFVRRKHGVSVSFAVFEFCPVVFQRGSVVILGNIGRWPIAPHCRV